MAVVGEVEYEVGNHPPSVVSPESPAGLVAQSLLCVKLLPLLQFEVFEQLLEFQFAEVSLHLHLPRQGAGQSVGGLAQRRTLPHVQLDGFVESCHGLLLLLLLQVESLLHIAQAPLQRVNNFRHLFHVSLAQFLLPCLEHILR